MTKTKISFFKKIYYWMCYYHIGLSAKFNWHKKNPIWEACTNLSGLRMLNLITLYGITTLIFPDIKYAGTDDGLLFTLTALVLILLLFFIDTKIFYNHEEEIIDIYCSDQFTKEQRMKDRTIFWIYVMLSFLSTISVIILSVKFSTFSPD